jgi:hypothetical protein
MNTDASAKIQMLKSSLRCFTFGLLGLIPLLGLPFAFAALWISGRVRVKEKLFWNAARPYRIWGVVCAAVGTVLWLGILAVVVARALMIAQGLG